MTMPGRYRMTDAEMAQVRAAFPRLRWRRDHQSGGASSWGNGDGYRIWITAYPAYAEPRTGWKADIDTAHYAEIDGVDGAATLDECLQALRALVLDAAGKWGALL